MKLPTKDKTLKQVIDEMAMLNSVRDEWHFKGLGNGLVEIVND